MPVHKSTHDTPDKADAHLQIRATFSEKSEWVRTARREGKKLAEWVTEKLNEAAMERNDLANRGTTDRK